MKTHEAFLALVLNDKRRESQVRPTYLTDRYLTSIYRGTYGVGEALSCVPIAGLNSGTR